MKKISWGVKIASTYLLFAIGIIAAAIFSMTEDVNLVTDNYYEKELKYQQQIDKLNRTKALPEQLQIKLIEDKIQIQFPATYNFSKISGTVNLYRPSDRFKDISLPIHLDSNGNHSISTSNLEKGLWKIKVDWDMTGASYFNEQIIMVQ